MSSAAPSRPTCLHSRASLAAAVCVLVASVPVVVAAAPACPKGMVSIAGEYCIDRYEAATVVIDAPPTAKRKPKTLRRHAPYERVEGGHVMAVSEKGRVPQAHISRDQAEVACRNAGKRLCLDDEWVRACRGAKATTYPYGDEHREGQCNDAGVSGFNKLFGPGNNVPPDASAYNATNMNDPRLNQLPGTLAKAGAFSQCRSSAKVYDLVGNLHEWTADPAGTFRGGYYLDTHLNGDGCNYRTTAHDRTYHDYSTGFRCCWGGAEQARIDRERRAKEKAEAEAKKRERAEAKAKKAREKAEAKKKLAAKKAREKVDAKKKADATKARRGSTPEKDG
jgi:sulfatase modifying factor 1